MIGVPDARVRRGDLRLDPDEARAGPRWMLRRCASFAEGRLAHYKIPRYVHVVEEFPMTVTGKIRKVEMREVTVEILGL